MGNIKLKNLLTEAPVGLKVSDGKTYVDVPLDKNAAVVKIQKQVEKDLASLLKKYEKECDGVAKEWKKAKNLNNPIDDTTVKNLKKWSIYKPILDILNR